MKAAGIAVVCGYVGEPGIAHHIGNVYAGLEARRIIQNTSFILIILPGPRKVNRCGTMGQYRDKPVGRGFLNIFSYFLGIALDFSLVRVYNVKKFGKENRI